MKELIGFLVIASIIITVGWIIIPVVALYCMVQEYGS